LTTGSATGDTLWTSDGTANGTYALNPVGSSANPIGFVAFGGRVFFTGQDAATGSELWATDNTAAGTGRVIDLVPGTHGSFPTQLTVSGGRLYFAAVDASGRPGLYVTDGSAVTLLHDVAISPDRTQLTDVGGTLLFKGPGASGTTLWRSDGTLAGTVPVVAGPAGTPGQPNDPDDLVNVGGTLFFTAQRTGGGANERALWRSDGTPAGTREVAPGLPTPPDPARLVALGDAVLFLGTTADAGRELWRSDGTPAGTYLLRDVLTGPASGFDLTSAAFTASSPSACYFVARDAAGTPQLWITDGTPAGTHTTVTTLPSGSSNFSPLPPTPSVGAALPGGRLVLASPGLDGDIEPWVTDGTPAGSFRLADLNTAPFLANLSSPMDLGGLLLFGYNGALYRSDGTAIGTTRVASVKPLGQAVRPSQEYKDDPGPIHAVTHGVAIFGVEGPTADAGGVTVWRSDGTPQGTYPLKNLQLALNDYQLPVGNTIGPFVAWRGDVYFVAYDTAGGREVWRTDGTVDGTVRVTDIFPGNNFDSGAQSIFARPDGVYFGYRQAPYVELWRTTGTPGDATLITRLGSDQNGWGLSIGRFIDAGARGFLFAADVVGRYRRLYVSDGTPAGTLPLTATLELDGPAVSLGDIAVFRAYDPIARQYGLYRSDGTDLGSVPVGAAVVPDRYRRLAVAGGYAYFVDDVQADLWRTDGTAAGTTRVADAPAEVGGVIRSLIAWRGAVYFTAIDATAGGELWVTDGTAAGTRRAADISPGPASSSPTSLYVAGDALYFTATRPDVGRELFQAIDDVAPRVANAAFIPAGVPGGSVRLRLSENVSFATGGPTLTGAGAEPVAVTTAYDAATSTLTVTPASPLADGDYRLTIPAAWITDASGNPLSADFTFDFFVLPGDINRDRSVDFNDLVILAKNFGTGARNAAQGDINGDGNVDFNDLVILAQRYDTSLPPPPVAAISPAPAPVAAASSIVRDRAAAKPIFSVTPVAKPAVKPKASLWQQRHR
jgi:ELWxxDGT repeat protein